MLQQYLGIRNEYYPLISPHGKKWNVYYPIVAPQEISRMIIIVTRRLKRSKPRWADFVYQITSFKRSLSTVTQKSTAGYTHNLQSMENYSELICMANEKTYNLVVYYRGTKRVFIRTYSRKLENGPYVWQLSSLITWKNVLDALKNTVEGEKTEYRRGKSCQK